MKCTNQKLICFNIIAGTILCLSAVELRAQIPIGACPSAKALMINTAVNTCKGGAEAAKASAEACSGAEKSAVGACERVQMTGQMMGLSTAAAQAIGSNDQKKLCETSMALNTLMGATNVTFGKMCSSAATTCKKACDKTQYNPAKTTLKACKEAKDLMAMTTCVAEQAEYPAINTAITDLETLVPLMPINESECITQSGTSKMAYVQAAMNGITAAQSLGCRNSAEDIKCDKIEDIKDTKKPQCYFQLCGPGGRFDGTTECKPTELDCTASVNFGAPYCVCKSNPQDPVCPGAGNASGGSGGSGSGGLDGGTGSTGGNTGTYGANNADGNFADDDLTNALGGDPEGGDSFGSKNNPSANGQAAGQPGSPFSPGGGFNGNPGANPGKGGVGKGPYNTDILQGPGGSSGYSAGGAGEYPFGSSGADAKNKDGMNLRDFLPGGKRGIAGQKELEKNGVSSDTGPSNFVKVTRQVNQLRRNKQTIDKP